MYTSSFAGHKAPCNLLHQDNLGLLLSTEAPVMTPSGVGFSAIYTKTDCDYTHGLHLQLAYFFLACVPLSHTL